MKISRRIHVFHNPFGSGSFRRGAIGSITACECLISRSDLNDVGDFDEHGRPIDDYRGRIDRVARREDSPGYIRGVHSVGKLRQ